MIRQNAIHVQLVMMSFTVRKEWGIFSYLRRRKMIDDCPVRRPLATALLLTTTTTDGWRPDPPPQLYLRTRRWYHLLSSLPPK